MFTWTPGMVHVRLWRRGPWMASRQTQARPLTGVHWFGIHGCAPLTSNPKQSFLNCWQNRRARISPQRVCFAFIFLWTPELRWLRFGALWDEGKGSLRFKLSTIVWSERCKYDKKNVLELTQNSHYFFSGRCSCNVPSSIIWPLQIIDFKSWI